MADIWARTGSGTDLARVADLDGERTEIFRLDIQYRGQIVTVLCPIPLNQQLLGRPELPSNWTTSQPLVLGFSLPSTGTTFWGESSLLSLLRRQVPESCLSDSSYL
jgi:hypothetical protein